MSDSDEENMASLSEADFFFFGFFFLPRLCTTLEALDSALSGRNLSSFFSDTFDCFDYFDELLLLLSTSETFGCVTILESSTFTGVFYSSSTV